MLALKFYIFAGTSKLGIFTLQVTQIGEAKPHKSKKCGILHCVHKYEHFVRDTERLFDRKLERRTEIEKVGHMTLSLSPFLSS